MLFPGLKFYKGRFGFKTPQEGGSGWDIDNPTPTKALDIKLKLLPTTCQAQPHLAPSDPGRVFSLLLKHTTLPPPPGPLCLQFSPFRNSSVIPKVSLLLPRSPIQISHLCYSQILIPIFFLLRLPGFLFILFVAPREDKSQESASSCCSFSLLMLSEYLLNERPNT